MPKTTDSVIFSDAEKEILELALQNPALSNSEIADETGYRLTLIRDTRREYEDDVELAEDVAEAAEADAKESTAGVDADLSETEQEILDLIAENPLITNADIAEQTGTRITLVRDTRDAYGDQVDRQPVTEEIESESTPSGPGEPSAAQQEILEVAASDHSLSNADIAEQTGSRITLVRDTLDQYDGPADSGSVDASEAAESADIETEGYSDAQAEILEAAAANPEATNRELAEKTGSRVTLVRDTLTAETADDNEDGTDDGGEDSDESDVLADIDTEAFSGAQLRILEVHLSNPELTNGEVAAKTDTRITLVRDTIYDYEYDEKPWVGNVEAEPVDEDDSDDEIIVDSDDDIEIPATTASDVFNDRQRAILETALENPELTNGEIADQTGTRITLVRDTRATYEEGVELPDDDSESSASTPSTRGRAVTFSEKQQEIIAAAEADEEATIAELADKTDARIPLVRDTLAVTDSAVERSEVDDGPGVDDPAEINDTATADDSAATEPATNEVSPTDDDGVSDGLLVAIVITIILLIGIAILLL